MVGMARKQPENRRGAGAIGVAGGAVPVEADHGTMTSRIEELCAAKGVTMTHQRRTIGRVLSESTDHPDVAELYTRIRAVDPQISIATVYRTLKLFEDLNVIERHDFHDGNARYEERQETHHDHLIDVNTGEIIEFQNEEIERLQEKVAAELGFTLSGHRLELYGVKIGEDER